MIKVVLVIHLIVAAAMIAIVLVQKSEGGALGIGGGGGGGGFLTGRGTANLLTRVTAGLAFMFFCTSLVLTIMAGGGASRDASRFNNAPAAGGTATPGAPKGDNAAGKPAGGSVLDRLKRGEGRAPVPRVPQSQ
jgi:preprotein translocase subunit SecG